MAPFTHHILFDWLLQAQCLAVICVHARDTAKFANFSDVHVFYGLSSLFIEDLQYNGEAWRSKACHVHQCLLLEHVKLVLFKSGV